MSTPSKHPDGTRGGFRRACLAFLALSSLFVESTAAAEAQTPKAWLGISFEDVAAPDLPSAFAHPHAEGAVKVLQVFPKSAAALGGIQEGDFLLAINGAALRGRSTLLDSVRAHGVGDVMAVRLGRDGRVLDLKMALSPRPEDMRALSQALIGGLAPSLHGTFYQGEAASLEALRGKVVLLDFWATWCGPCRMTLPALDALSREYGDQGLVVIGVSNENQSELDAFQRKAALGYPLVRDPEGRTQRAYQAFAYPTLALIGKDGKVARIETGAHPKATVEAWIRELL